MSEAPPDSVLMLREVLAANRHDRETAIEAIVSQRLAERQLAEQAAPPGWVVCHLEINDSHREVFAALHAGAVLSEQKLGTATGLPDISRVLKELQAFQQIESAQGGGGGWRIKPGARGPSL